MANSEKVYGVVPCSCGAVLRLPFPRGTESPAWFRTWCSNCGALWEGNVSLDECDESAPADGETAYVDIDDIEPMGPPEEQGREDE